MYTLMCTGERKPGCNARNLAAEVDSSRTRFEVLGLGREASSPRKLPCLDLFKICRSPEKCFCRRLFLGIAWKKFLKTFFYFLKNAWKFFLKSWFFFFFFGEYLRLCPWPWPQAFLSLASRGSVLRRAVLGLSHGFFCVLGLGLEPSVLDSTSV